MADLVIQGLAKSFARTVVLERIDLAVTAGETVVVFGPSGAGKTVLLRLVSGVLEPDAGDIRIDGRSVVGLGPERRDVGMAFQNFALYPHLSAFENIASPLHAQGLDAASVRGRVEAIARLLKIDHVLHHLPRELSNGQKQRTSLARSLVGRPGVLLLDDPLRNVDAKLRYEMRLELPRLLRDAGSAVLYVTQDYKEAMAIGDRIAVLRGGRIEQLAPPAAVYREPETVEVARLFGDPTINLYPCRPRHGDDGTSVSLFGGSLALPPGLAHAAGRDCLLGLRPEHVAVSVEERPAALPFELEAVTPLNVRGVLYLRAGGGEELLATVPEAEAARFGRGRRRVWVEVEPRHLTLFDRDTGARLAPRAA
ncbi:MAG: ABC transporter ATP-binding protein [Rhodospirillaceae bacterium]|nr:ABC transporter ATP-binding protein [Rhodospirillaceae bacterium]